jgi:hypothetical protein
MEEKGKQPVVIPGGEGQAARKYSRRRRADHQEQQGNPKIKSTSVIFNQQVDFPAHHPILLPMHDFVHGWQGVVIFLSSAK